MRVKIAGTIKTGTAFCLFGVLAAVTGPLLAEDKKAPVNPVGAGWAGTVKPGTAAQPDGQQYTPEQISAIKVVSDYFNGIQNIAGRFEQTNPDKKVQRGKFLLQRPGRFRFDYNRPSRQIIVSDGTYLAIQDLDLKTEDIYTLQKTPFRVLLQKDVDLLRDARIIAVEQNENQIAVALADKDPDTSGQITVYMAVKPQATLAGWVTTDIQGGVTRVEVSDLERPTELDAQLFKRRMLNRGTTQ